jgi:hypothetical protein
MNDRKKQRKRPPRKSSEAIDREGFLSLLAAEFPEVPAAFDECVKGLLHCEMGAFAGIAEAAMDQGRFWQVQKYFQLVDRARKSASPDLENAIDVSFIEFLASSEVTENRHRAMKLMPADLRQQLLVIDGRGRWE